MTDYTHTVHIPHPLPEEYRDFAPAWLEWVQNVNTQPVIVLHEQAMGLSTGSEVGYLVDSDAKPKYAIHWLPKGWLVSLKDISKKICNCSPRDLFNFGCKGH